jgi:hypothetical protein
VRGWKAVLMFCCMPVALHTVTNWVRHPAD